MAVATPIELAGPEAHQQPDLREEIFRSIANQVVTASVIAEYDGVVAEIEEALQVAQQLGLEVSNSVSSGHAISAGDKLLTFSGSPMAIATAEDRVIGCISKPSGIATKARAFVEKAAGRTTIVAGAWKKMPISLKPAIRAAAIAGGARPRISESPFIYLDKNYVRLFGGIAETLRAVEGIDGRRRVVQICGDYAPIDKEAEVAAAAGADIVFVDTGRPSDLDAAIGGLRDAALRDRVEVAFGGGITLTMIDELCARNVDLVDIGRAIVDAPLLDLRLTIESTA